MLQRRETAAFVENQQSGTLRSECSSRARAGATPGGHYLRSVRGADDYRFCAKMRPMVEGFEALSEAWDRHAEAWARWTRVPGHDVYHELLNWPAFRTLVPPAGRRTLDVGCGEGRAGRQLSAGGHRVAGIDSSPTLVRLAREAGGYDELVWVTLPSCRGRPRRSTSRLPTCRFRTWMT